MKAADFPAFFRAARGVDPFPWQERLAERVCAGDGWPDDLALPTGCGKTAALDVAVFHLALEADKGPARAAPCRVVLVVDRRLVVDGAYERARVLADRLAGARDGILRDAADRLRLLAEGDRPLRPVRLRGGVPLEPDWARTPGQPVVAVSTVDQAGSRLLFRGYGVGEGMRPVHAGLLGSDSLFLLDEAHLSRPFRDTLARVRAEAAPDDRPPRVTAMTATPDADTENLFTLDATDDAHPVLRRRLAARKPARLVEARASRDDAPGQLAGVFRDQALNLAGRDSGRVVAVVVNRVALARRIFNALRQEAPDGATVTLRLGRARPEDRRALEGEDAALLADSRTREGGPPWFVVATQTVEVGADFDFDALVTQAAPLDALRQRFGRLDRLGARGQSPAAIIAAPEDRYKKAVDPVYGNAVAATWHWLKGQAKKKVVDFGLDALPLPEGDDRAPLLPPRKQAPVLFPAYIDKWSATRPAPAADPAVPLFLHGPDTAPPEVSVVWRADVHKEENEQKKKKARAEDAREDQGDAAALRLLPPTAPEGVNVPLPAVRAWLRRQPGGADMADVEGGAAAETAGRGGLRVWRWHDGDPQRVSPNALRPGDLVVVPADVGGCDAYGWAPGSGAAVADVAETALVRQRRRLVLRLHPAVLGDAAWAAVAPLLDELHEEPAELVNRLATDPPEGTPTELVCKAGVLRKTGVRVEMLDKGPGLVLAARRRLTLREAAALGHDDPADVGAEPATESDAGTFAAPVPLDTHLEGVGDMARRFAEQAGLSAAVAADVALAGRLHDLGKGEQRFQAFLHQGDEIAAARAGRPIAKGAGAPTRAERHTAHAAAGLPPGARHEAWSVALAQGHPALADAHDRELVLWLIGTHHGHGRPFFPPVEEAGQTVFRDPDGHDHTQPADPGVVRLDSGWPARFEALRRRYGAWGLARLEALVRLADHRVSEDQDSGEAP